ncbi:uncharacterized protein LOC106162818 isoform X1 [Lingula anatina]|uniref:Uncharacterized protein LOC106162818 isoform X1 n=1 Tax=Lingula anatina TaxID=7574 RepID=A0A2R2MLE0_LINAN|nr:uncharacterized protein LOC106162818 isoform X1 [Lingula anatina]|eukprot:XP_023931025.1 uncharacterized protein LOC106162818 isoform X1 [Lingula anatina]
MKQVTAVIVGAGNRGQNYAEFADEFPEKLKVVGVAEPRVFYRTKMQQTYGIPDTAVFSDWKELLKIPKMADLAIIATPDQLHKEPVVALAKKGYHILLEKPMATTEQDCIEIVETCKQAGVMLAVCHVLRYTLTARKIKEIIDSGVIGEVTHLQLLEPVGFWHFAHSYVRGNWRNERQSSFSLLAKSCHDLDLLNFWMHPAKVSRISSMGSLMHFTKENKPQGASSRCMDCSIENSCPYSAKKLYLDEMVKQGNTRWPVSVITDVPDIESVTEALKTGPYGRCVYDCDNDVMSNQVVNFQFDGGQTASFTMVAFTEKICARQVQVYGSKGELRCDFDSQVVHHYDFLSQSTTSHSCVNPSNVRLRGHGGADHMMMVSLVDAIATNDPSKILTGSEETLLSHKLVFAAEKARKENRVVEFSV